MDGKQEQEISQQVPTGKTLWMQEEKARQWGKAFSEPILGQHMDRTEKDCLEAVLKEEEFTCRKIIDVGCGTGRYFSFFPDVEVAIGVDISVEMLRLAKEDNPDVSFIVADITKLPFKDGVFDCVLSTRTLQHVVDQRTAVGELARLVAKEGRLVPLFFNALTLHCLYKNYRQSAPVRAIDQFLNITKNKNRLLKPFLGSWEYNYDNYIFFGEMNKLLKGAGLTVTSVRGVTLGGHWILIYFYLGVLLQRNFSPSLRVYFNLCMVVERCFRSRFPFKYLMDKIMLSAVRQ